MTCSWIFRRFSTGTLCLRAGILYTKPFSTSNTPTMDLLRDDSFPRAGSSPNACRETSSAFLIASSVSSAGTPMKKKSVHPMYLPIFLSATRSALLFFSSMPTVKHWFWLSARKPGWMKSTASNR